MNIVFDIGNVLIRWRPEAALSEHFPDPAEARAYLNAVGFFDWNLAQDGGRDFARGLAVLERAHPGQTAPLARYAPRFALTIREPIAETWVLLGRLQARGHRLFAITNFAAETWLTCLALYPDLPKVFDDIVVSAHEGVTKPAPAIYHRLLSRNQLHPAECLFIDDSPANVAGARRVGMQAVAFATPARLHADLIARALLPAPPREH